MLSGFIKSMRDKHHQLHHCEQQYNVHTCITQHPILPYNEVVINYIYFSRGKFITKSANSDK